MKPKVKSTAAKLLIVLLGNILYGVTVAVFIEPSGLITGGVTGIAIALERLTGFSVSIYTFALNLVLFVLGIVFLGREFAATTAVSTVVYPVAMHLTERVLNGRTLTDDIVLCTVLGGLLIGLSVGMVMRVGSSTGGLDIPPLILQKYMGLPLGITVYLFDFAVLIFQMFFVRGDAALYGVILVVIYSVFLEKVIALGQSKLQVTVVSEKADAIRRAILERLDRGVTMLAGKTGFTGAETELVMSVLSTRELPKIKVLVQQLDPEAFMVITQVSEVRGRGFSFEKKHLQDR
ncbi:MAG: YitT family protein [Oscillospiraceae bacterium]|jgi:uncharacterized membrane-anchored protein YitT (DUF2179 family)|nr:YitT family protein [Oscillospiraceae bacterium]MBR6429806.1 YitT family protein [Oscillospiraceae bacterium]